MDWSDVKTNVAEIQRELQRFNTEREWSQYHSPRNLAMAVSVESGELLERFLWFIDGGNQALEKERQAIEEEAADVLICLLNFCAISRIDLSAAVAKKIQKNAKNYPVDMARGRMDKHTKLKEEVARSTE